MFKRIIYIVTIIMIGISFISCTAKKEDIETKKTNYKEEYIDFDMYPYRTMKGKGVLYMDKSELLRKQIVIFSFDDNGGGAGLWYIGGNNVSIYDHNKYAKIVPNAQKFAYRNPEDIYIVIKDYFNVIDDGEYFIVSAQVVSNLGYYTVPIRVKKEHVTAYGFKYIPLENIVEICRKNPYMVKSVIGEEITLSAAEIQRNEPEQNVVSKPGEEITLSRKAGLINTNKRKIYLLRTKPSLSADFVDIEEHEINTKIVLSKRNYWYELEVSSDFADEKSQNDTYRGFWQAPYDNNGFPYLITEMVDNNWKILSEEYFSKR